MSTRMASRFLLLLLVFKIVESKYWLKVLCLCLSNHIYFSWLLPVEHRSFRICNWLRKYSASEERVKGKRECDASRAFFLRLMLFSLHTLISFCICLICLCMIAHLFIHLSLSYPVFVIIYHTRPLLNTLQWSTFSVLPFPFSSMAVLLSASYSATRPFIPPRPSPDSPAVYF